MKAAINAFFYLAVLLVLASCGNNEPIEDPRGIPGALLNLTGLDYYHSGDLENAEYYFNEALRDAEAEDHLSGQADSLFNATRPSSYPLGWTALARYCKVRFIREHPVRVK
ncbi:MAG: hypothetical protein AAF517_10160, partial [Planctomycetota bacterium]